VKTSFACLIRASVVVLLVGGGSIIRAQSSVAERLASRSFPSVFQAWGEADNLPSEDELTTVARHDLIFHGAGYFGLEWNHFHEGLADGFKPASIKEGLKRREQMLKKNPSLVILAEIRYRDGPPNFLPKNHGWWKRDETGQLVAGWAEGGYTQLDFANLEYQKHIAKQARAAVESGVVDGVLLDWWDEDEDRLSLIKAIRSAIGEDALILANANDRTAPLTAPYINGFFMECDRSATPAEWQKIRTSLVWAEKNLREPRINCLETWFHQSRDDLNLMRATTTLSLTHSDGMCLFSEPNTLPGADHRHNWYPFWTKRLGRPRGPGESMKNGSVLRRFENGFVIHNSMGNGPVTELLPQRAKSVTTGRQALTHSIADCDGDIFITEP
jgi:hypothetical protein